MCFGITTLLLLITGRYLWIGPTVDDNWNSSFLKDSSLNHSLSGVSQYSHCIPGSLPDSLAKLYELYDDVETFVMFIGYPRSSHSLVGSILDAHPKIIISNEYHIIEKWNIYRDIALKSSGMSKYLLFYNLHSISTWQATFGSRARKPIFIDDHIYSYNVPGAWQGTFNGKLKVIGDKRGGGTTMELSEKPEKFAILKELNEILGIPLKFLHVIRNPFDVISTWVLRLLNARLRVNDGKTKINSSWAVDNAIKSFFELIETNERIRQLYGHAVLDVLSHELILKPRETMKTICTFIGVTCNEDYLYQAENIMFGKPSHTRRTVVWTEEQKQRVLNEMKKYSFLQSFSSFEEEQ
ncbi:hypothetical protein OS493_007098 [Desmophyllum pertusum]|uniref:Protein-tyrosine sulfotransferase n=1 Tax=Desmophyllum pertusum TaxID=174260 RepID=A0A9W9ZG57_9CNID|nr:hypothetical protein OS493_007098 [Desmophyllum pertusum]